MMNFIDGIIFRVAQLRSCKIALIANRYSVFVIFVIEKIAIAARMRPSAFLRSAGGRLLRPLGGRARINGQCPHGPISIMRPDTWPRVDRRLLIYGKSVNPDIKENMLIRFLTRPARTVATDSL